MKHLELTVTSRREAELIRLQQWMRATEQDVHDFRVLDISECSLDWGRGTQDQKMSHKRNVAFFGGTVIIAIMVMAVFANLAANT